MTSQILDPELFMKRFLLTTLCSTALISSVQADPVMDRLPEHVGFGSGILIGAAVAGPVGAIVAGTMGVMLGHDVLQDRALLAEQQKRSAAEADSQLASQERDRALQQLRAESTALAHSRAEVSGAQAQLVAMQQILESVSIPVFFDVDSATAHARHADALSALAQALSAVSALRLELTGYADTSGSISHNQTLSVARAASVSALLNAAGVETDRMQVAGKGESLSAPFDPLTAGADRRVDIQFRFEASTPGAPAHESLYSIR